MLRWFFYEEEETPQHSTHGRGQQSGREASSRNRERGNAASAAASRGGGASDTDVNPTFDDLDPVVTAAILTQVRGGGEVSPRGWYDVGW